MNWKHGLRILAAGIFFLLPWAASAQQVNMYWNTGGCSQFSCWGPVSAANPLPVSASVTASIAGYHPSSSLTPITATTGGVTSGSFTAGQSILVQNVGSTNAAYCAPGSSASTSSQYIAPGSSALITTTSETTITCATSTSTTTVNFQVGTGLWTGAGGGGGGGGSSGAVFGPTAVGSANANPPVVIGGTVTGAAGQNVEGVAVKPASTAALATDFSLVTNESPNSQLSVAIGTSADAPCTLPATTTACSQLALAKATANAAASPLAAGSIVGIDQTTPGTTNGVAPSTPVGTAAFAATQVSVGSTATSILSSRTGVPGTGRASATVTNTTTTAIFIGGSGVTTSTGTLLPGIVGASITINTTAAIFGIVATGTATVTALESF